MCPVNSDVRPYSSMTIKFMLVICSLLLALVLQFGSSVAIAIQASYMYGVHHQLVDRKQLNPELNQEEIDSIRLSLTSVGPIKGNLKLIVNFISIFLIINSVCIILFWSKKKMA